MSLLTSVNAGTPAVNYFIENVGGTNNPAPCIKGGLLGPAPGFSDTAVRVGNPVDGMVLTGGGGTYLPLLRGINGGSADTTGGESLVIGSSETSFQNIVLTDNATRVNSDLTLGAAATVGSGDIIFANGGTGSSISGYFSGVTQVVVPNTGVGQVIANPAGITAGLYAITTDYTTAGNEAIQVATVAYYTGAVWQGGNAVSAAGPGSAVLAPSPGAATIDIAQSGGGAVTANVRFRKLLN
jgi:hypothetical protein